MLTHRSAEEIEALMAELETEPTEVTTHEVDADLLARALAPPPGPAAPLAPPTSPTPATTGSSVAPPSPPPPRLGPMVGVTATLQPPKAPGATNTGGSGGGGLRLGGVTGALGAPRDPEKPADAESWAEFYESTDGRFPLLVARLQGKGAFGCDLLSFASAEDRETFKAAPSRIDLIVRYIEVKSGGVRLVANEIDAAQKHGPKYFVYRIQFEGDGRDAASLTLVSDPLSHGRALARECEIRMDEIDTSVQVRLKAVRAAPDFDRHSELE